MTKRKTEGLLRHPFTFAEDIALEDGGLHVFAKLGFLAAMFKDPIEAEIRRVLQERF